MGTSIYKFEGRLLVNEATALKANYPAGSGIAFRIGQVRQVEKVLSIDNNYAIYGLITPLNEVRISNNEIFVVMRGMSVGLGTSGVALSGAAGLGLASGIVSGLAWMGELRSGAPISGKITVTANVIGY